MVSSWAESSAQVLRDIRKAASNLLVGLRDSPHFFVAGLCEMAMKGILERPAFLLHPLMELPKLCAFSASFLEIGSATEDCDNVSLTDVPVGYHSPAIFSNVHSSYLRHAFFCFFWNAVVASTVICTYQVHALLPCTCADWRVARKALGWYPTSVRGSCWRLPLFPTTPLLVWTLVGRFRGQHACGHPDIFGRDASCLLHVSIGIVGLNWLWFRSSSRAWRALFPNSCTSF